MLAVSKAEVKLFGFLISNIKRVGTAIGTKNPVENPNILSLHMVQSILPTEPDFMKGAILTNRQSTPLNA